MLHEVFQVRKSLPQVWRPQAMLVSQLQWKEIEIEDIWQMLGNAQEDGLLNEQTLSVPRPHGPQQRHGISWLFFTITSHPELVNNVADLRP